MALCGVPRHEDAHRDILTNPCLIVEVLSESTEAYDRSDKFAGYKAIASLREYVLISRDEVKVERHRKEGDFWIRHVETGLDATIGLASVGCAFSLREIYNRTEFVEEPVPATGVDGG